MYPVEGLTGTHPVQPKEFRRDVILKGRLYKQDEEMF